MNIKRYTILETRIANRNTYIYSAIDIQAQEDISVINLLRHNVDNAMKITQDISKFFNHSSFLQLKGLSVVKNSKSSARGLHKAVAYSDPVSCNLVTELLRRKAHGMSFCYDDISALFSCIYKLSNHIVQHQAKNESPSGRSLRDWLRNALILKDCTVKVFPLEEVLVSERAENFMEALDHFCSKTTGTCSFAQDSGLNAMYIELYFIILYMQNCHLLIKSRKLTSGDLESLIKAHFSINHSHFWEQYTQDALSNTKISEYKRKGRITGEDMKQIVLTNEICTPPIDPDLFDVWRQDFVQDYYTTNSAFFDDFQNKTLVESASLPDELKYSIKLELCDVKGSAVFFKNITLCTHIVELVLVSCSINFEGLSIINNAHGFDRIELLDLSNLLIDEHQNNNTFGASGLIELVDKGALLTRVKTLKLRAIDLSTKSVTHLVSSPRASTIQTLDLGYNSDLTNTAYYSIRSSEYLSNLTELILSGCRLGDIGLYYLLLAEEAPQVESIMDFRENDKALQEVTNDIISKFKAALTQKVGIKPTSFQLTHLRVDVCSLESYSLALVCCANAFQFLEELDLSFATLDKLDYSLFEESSTAVDNLRRIKNLSLRSTELQVLTSQRLFKMLDQSELEYLSLEENANVSVSNILADITLPKLRGIYLDLMGKQALTEVDMQRLTGGTLEDFRCSFTSLQKKGSNPGQFAMTLISRLSICCMRGVLNDDTSEILMRMSNTPVFNRCYFLDLSENCLTSLSVFKLPTANFSNVRYLNLSGNKFSFKELANVTRNQQLSGLQVLDLTLCSLEDKALSMFKHNLLSSLEYLLIGENKFTIKGIKAHIKKLPKYLKYLDVFCEGLPCEPLRTIERRTGVKLYID